MEIIGDKYRVENIKLGSGAFADVYLGTNLITGQKIAIKKVSLTQKNLQSKPMFEKLELEVKLMQQLKHPNIVDYYDIIRTSTDWYIIMEYCNAGTLDDVIKFNKQMSNKKAINFNREANTYYYLDQLKDALNYIRKNGYIHRDIKPMNVLLTRCIKNETASLYDSGTIFKSDEQLDQKNSNNNSEKIVVKLADFGLAKHYLETEESLMSTLCGSPLYMAPELFFNREYNSQADLWSYGVIMYQMLFGVYPNNATTFKDLVQNLKTNNIDFHLSGEKNFTPYCFDLLTKLLVKDPNKRIDWPSLFKHKWFQYWNDVHNGKLEQFSDPMYEKYNEQQSDKTKLAQSKLPSTSLKHSQKNLYSVSPQNTLIEHDKNTSSRRNSSSLSTNLSSSPSLGQSNLSRMKMDTFSPRNYIQGTYSDYPSSYPPSDPKGSLRQSIISNKFLSETKPISIPSTSKNLLNSYSRSCGTPTLTKNNGSRSRIFSNLYTSTNALSFGSNECSPGSNAPSIDESNEKILSVEQQVEIDLPPREHSLISKNNIESSFTDSIDKLENNKTDFDLFLSLSQEKIKENSLVNKYTSG